MAHRWRKYFVVAVFLAMILIPGVLSICKIKIGEGLSGAIVTAPEPAFSVSAVLEGSWQNSLDNWMKDHLSVREPMIRLGNQFLFTFFQETSNKYFTVGTNKTLFENVYLEEELQYKTVSDVYVNELVAKLERVQGLLQEKGKQLFVFITPMKSSFFEEAIPWNWKLAAPEQGASSYDKLLTALQLSDVPFYDSVPYVQQLEESGHTIWYRTGIHWTSVTGMMVSQELSDAIEQEFGYDFPEISVEAVPCEEPIYPDADIFNNFNLLQKPYDTYSMPEITVKEEGKDLPHIFIRGGSFCGQSVMPLIRYSNVESFSYLENTEGVQHLGDMEEKFVFKQYEELDIPAMLEDKDLVLLEVNQESIDRMSFGFIDYLLDSGILAAKE